MFNWFGPSCPIDPEAKKWIESHLEWLEAEFESSVFTDKRMILPVHEFFPDRYDGSDDSVRQMLERVCGYMEVDPGRVQLKLLRDVHDLPLVNDSGDYVSMVAAGTYSARDAEWVIRINTADLHNPMAVVGTMAHELAHGRLMGEERVSGKEFDNELLTDLTATFHGFGIFQANHPRAWKSMMSLWPGSTLKRPEYMSAPMYAYALAHIAWHREESKPAWARHLASGPRANFSSALRYLERTRDSSFKPSWCRFR